MTWVRVYISDCLEWRFFQGEVVRIKVQDTGDLEIADWEENDRKCTSTFAAGTWEIIEFGGLDPGE